MVDRERVLDGRAIRTGDLLVALPSAGLHTNGYSLARKIFFEVAGKGPTDRVDGLQLTVEEALLAEHRSYLAPLRGALDAGLVHGLAHITGGGLSDNIPRVLPKGTAARITRGRWPVLPVFETLQRLGNVAEDEM